MLPPSIPPSISFTLRPVIKLLVHLTMSSVTPNALILIRLVSSPLFVLLKAASTSCWKLWHLLVYVAGEDSIGIL